ncbi:MAG TPA: PadR family transcriptional regulator [Gammaproteobacteria bacterium]|nr:PadR family transcriptional regulator [Gammaproteobacteria bacterium]
MKRSSKTRFAVLGILSIKAASGYDIKKTMEKCTDHFWREGDGSIYPVLKQLLKEQMVTCKLGNAESDKPKKIYTITNKGKLELNKWLEEDPVLFQNRNELMLKVFFGANMNSNVTVKHIEKFCRQINKNLDYYKETAKKMMKGKLSGHNLYQYMTLQAGIIYSEAGLKWSEESLNLLKKVKT